MVFEGNAKKTVEGMARRLDALKLAEVENVYKNRTVLRQVMELDTERGEILAVEQDGRFYLLNSYYDAESASAQWAKQFESDDINENSIIIVFGLSDGKSILELCKKRSDCRILIYEPCEEVFWKAMHYDKVVELVELENVCLLGKGCV